MNILQVMAGAEMGGAETAFIDIVLALHAAGAKQRVVTRDNPRLKHLRAAGIPVDVLPFGGFLDFYTPYRLRQIIAADQPGIVQTWMSRATAKTPAWTSGPTPRYLKIARLGGYYKMKYYQDVDYFVTNTPDIRRYVLDQGIAPARVFHINNFADIGAPKTTLQRRDYATPDDAFLIVALGRLHPVKAFDTLLAAIAPLPNVYLWIGGEGPERGNLQNLTHQLGIADRVRFLGWWNDRAALFAAGDICVFPSRFEPFGNVFVQAWEAGVPLITSLSEGPQQYVHEGQDALTFPVDDVDALRDQIIRLRDNPTLRQHIAQQGRARYLNEFTPEKTVTAYLNLYADLLRQNNLCTATTIAPSKTNPIA